MAVGGGGGKWTNVLVGPWWPQASTGLRDASRHWSDMSQQQEQFSQGLNSTMTNLSKNKGVTADDLIGQFHHGSNFHLDLAEKYQAKSRAFGSAADAIDNLRSGLRSIADEYNKNIEDVEKKSSHGNAAARALAVAEITQLITEANGLAASKSAAAVASLNEALQKILTAEGSGMSPQEFMQHQGIQTKEAKPPNAELAANHGLSNLGHTGDAGKTPADAVAHSGADPAASNLGNAGDAGRGSDGALHVTPAGNVTSNPGAGGNSGGSSNSPFKGAHIPTDGAHIPGSGAPGSGGLSPAALGGNGLSPSSLQQSFESGMQSGQPVAAGAQSVTGSAMHASAPPPAAAPEAPQAAPRAIPTLAASGDGGGFESSQHGGVGSASSVGSSAPTVMGGSVGAAGGSGGGTGAPVGPLPAYGSDLRPMAAASPVAPAMPAGPVGGAPVAASPASSPAAAGGLVSPVERSVPAASARAQGNASSGSVGAGLVAGAAGGAVAGDAAKRVVAQRDLQAKVDAVARQEPAIAWAVGLLDDETTVLLTTDVAGGWIPPDVELPTGVTLLAPSERRRDVSAVDLLGSVAVAAAYQPHGYIGDAGPGDPALTGERARHGLYVDEFGPSLVDSVTRRAGLPAVTQGVAKAAVRRTGVLESEVDQLREALRGIRAEVLGTYPQHDPVVVAKWMLLASIEAVVDGHQELANYHFAWYTAVFASRSGRR